MNAMKDKLRQAMEAAQSAPTEDADAAINEVLGEQDEVGIFVPTEAPPTPQFTIKGLDQKAVLVQLTRRMYSPYKRDEEETEQYGAGNVNKHLFKGPNNRVKKAMSAYGEVYAFVKDNTVPWSTGIDLLNIDNYMEFTRQLRPLLAKAEACVQDLLANWTQEVHDDMHRLALIAQSKGKPNLVNQSDYPTTAEMATKWGIEIRYLPVPSTGDFRVNISDEDKESLQRMLEEAGQNAATHVIKQMMEPMERAVEKLKVPIGQDGSIFRDSLVDNLVEVADRMNRVNISDDPVIQQQIDNLKLLVHQYAGRKDALRSNSIFRSEAVRQIDTLMTNMKGLV